MLARPKSLRWSQYILEEPREELNSDSEVEEGDSDANQLSKTLSLIATYGVQVTIERAIEL